MFDVYLVALGVTMFKVREYATLEINVLFNSLYFHRTFDNLTFYQIKP